MSLLRVPFFQAVNDCTGGNVKVQRKDYLSSGDVPVIDQGKKFIAGFTESGNRYSGSLPLILFGDHTRIFKYVDFPFALGADGVKALQALEGFDPKYLYFYFRTVQLPDAGYSRHFKFLKEITVPKPPLHEQRRLVDLLSRAEGIVRLRLEAERKAAEVTPALFLDMFGNPATNPKKWPTKKIGNLGRVQLGRQRAPKYQTGKHSKPYVRVANVFEDRIDVTDVLTMDFDEKDYGQYRLAYGDILLNEGQSIELVGRPAMWRDEVRDCCFQNTLVRFQPDRHRMLPDFALAAMLHYYRSGTLSAISSKTSNVAHLGASRFANLTLFCPPVDLQKDFADRSESVRAIQIQQQAACAKAQTAFDALLAGAFIN
jgi:restriction endonuclease S subunit